jgi:dipeptide/tripeptide permease
MKIFDKYKNLDRKDKSSVFLLLFIVVFTIAIWILALNNLFNPLLALILMTLMIVIIRLDMKNKEKEEREKMK